MDFDTVPTTVYVTDVMVAQQTASMLAVDVDGAEFSIIVTDLWRGARGLFVETIQEWLLNHDDYPLTSRYDANADEWFVRAGNYSIHSKSLQFNSLGS